MDFAVFSDPRKGAIILASKPPHIVVLLYQIDLREKKRLACVERNDTKEKRRRCREKTD
jgi:hypothetical protein